MNRSDRSSLLLGLAAFFGPLVLYVITMRPDIDFWDTGEMQTVPWLLGIAHPTGFPAFVLGGFAFAHLVPIGNVAWRLTLFSSVAMATAAWCIFAAARELRLAPATAIFGAWIFASSALAWSRGTRTEVHALAIAAIGLTLWIGLRFLRTRDMRLIPCGALAVSLGLAAHPVVVFFVPLMLAWAIIGFRAMPHSPRWRVACIAAIWSGPFLYAYMPLRSAWLTFARVDPTLTLGLPPGRPYWDYGHTAGLHGFLEEISGSAFTVGGGFSGIVQPAVYAALPRVFFEDLQTALGAGAALPLMVLGIAGCAWRIGGRRGALAIAALCVFGFLAVPFAASYTSESDVPRYFLGAYWIATLLFVAGVETLRDIATRYMPANLRPAALMPAIAFLLSVTFTNIHGNWDANVAQHGDFGARRFIERVRAHTPADAIVVSYWTYATPLAYAAYVERSMQERIVETAWPAQDVPYFRTWRSRPIVVVTADGQPPPGTQGIALDTGYPHLILITAVR